MCPSLDLDEVLFSVEFAADPGTCTVLRQAQTVDSTGRASSTPAYTDISSYPWSSVVTSPSANKLMQYPELQRIAGSVQVITNFPLQVAAEGFAADVVNYLGVDYTVTDLTDYTQFGGGYVIALCVQRKPV